MKITNYEEYVQEVQKLVISVIDETINGMKEKEKYDIYASFSLSQYENELKNMVEAAVREVTAKRRNDVEKGKIA